MRTITIISTLLFFLTSAAQSNSAALFIPDVLGKFPNVRDFTMDRNSSTIMFSVQNYSGGNSTIIEMKETGSGYNTPQIVAFSGKYNDLEPYFSQDGLRVYFASNRPLDQSSEQTKDYDIWMVERQNLDEDWSEPTNLGHPINTEKDEFYPAITESGNMYFTLNKDPQGTKDDIYLSEFKDGKYLEPVAIKGGVNTEGYEFNAFIFPDESYIIFSGYNREDGFGSGDLYISKNAGYGEWTKAINLGASVNSEKLDYCPFVDLDKNILYFTSLRLLEENSTKATKTIEDLINQFEKKDGLSKLYNINISELLKSLN